ncbi:exported hypothetical protein [Candidatus Magnetomoraceae bacterium gMMP-1]
MFKKILIALVFCLTMCIGISNAYETLEEKNYDARIVYRIKCDNGNIVYITYWKNSGDYECGSFCTTKSLSKAVQKKCGN